MHRKSWCGLSEGITGPTGSSKRPTHSPSQPRRAETRPSAGEAASNEHIPLVRVPGAKDRHGCTSSHFHLMLQPMLAFWLLSTGFPASTASIAARRSRPVTGLLLPGRLSSSCPR